MYYFNPVTMNELDKLIRETNIEKTSDNFTSELMEKIRPLPEPQASSPAQISIWFKLLMSGVFIGALILAIFSMGSNSGASGIRTEFFHQGLQYLSGLSIALQTWIIQHIWLIPSILFSITGFLYLLTWKQDLHHQVS